MTYNILQHERVALKKISSTLLSYYSEISSWKDFYQKPSSWRNFIYAISIEDNGNPGRMMDSGIIPLPLGSLKHPRYFENFPPKPRENDFFPVPPPFLPPPHETLRVPLKSDLHEGLKFFPRRPDFFAVRERLTLFNENKEYIAGLKVGFSDAKTLPLKNEQKIIGYLGIVEQTHLTYVFDLVFFKKEMVTVYFSGLFIILISAFFALIFSRQLLKPLNRLMKGTELLSRKEFEKRIEVKTGDELQVLAEAFNSMAEKLQKEEFMQKQWLSDISHELRTPLTVLRGELEALIDGIYSISPEKLKSLHEEILHLVKIVNDLHELSIAEKGSLKLDNTELDLLKLWEKTRNLYNESFQKAKIKIIEKIVWEKPLRVLGDAFRLRQVIDNILENSLKYVQKPGVLLVELYQENGFINFVFEDSGPGVPEEALSKLFDRLYRVDPSRRKEEGSSGLGLAICKKLISLHKGEILAEKGTKGLKIVIKLPAL